MQKISKLTAAIAAADAASTVTADEGIRKECVNDAYAFNICLHI